MWQCGPMDRLAPIIQPAHDCIMEQALRFVAKGYEPAIEPFGQSTLGGRRGVRLTVTPSDGRRSHVLTVEVPVGAIEHCTVKVDGMLPAWSDTQFPLRADFVVLVKKIIDNFLTGLP